MALFPLFIEDKNKSIDELPLANRNIRVHGFLRAEVTVISKVVNLVVVSSYRRENLVKTPPMTLF